MSWLRFLGQSDVRNEEETLCRSRIVESAKHWFNGNVSIHHNQCITMYFFGIDNADLDILPRNLPFIAKTK